MEHFGSLPHDLEPVENPLAEHIEDEMLRLDNSTDDSRVHVGENSVV